MPYNGSGVFTRLYSWVTDRNNSIPIEPVRMDAEMDGIATGLSNAITKDGQTTITANLPFNDKRLTGVGDATADTDALNRRTGDARYLELDGTNTMTGPVRALDGSAASPSYTFGSDTNSGFYRAAADDVRGAVNGADVFRMRTVGVDVTGALAATGNVSGQAITGTTGTFSGAITMQSRAVDAFPTGTKMLFQQTAAPTGWTKDTTHDNKALRVVSGTAASGGTTAFTSVFSFRTIAEANLPSHTHGVGTLANATTGDHTHFVVSSGTSTSPISSGNYAGNNADYGGTNAFNYLIRGAAAVADQGISSNAGNHTHTISGATAATGSGTALDFAVAYVDVIICTKN